MNWLQIGCPHCQSEMSVPAFMADRSTTCDACGRAFRVPLPTRPILAGESPLVPVAILMTPGMRGNQAEGLSPIAQLPPMAANEVIRDSSPIAAPAIAPTEASFDESPPTSRVPSGHRASGTRDINSLLAAPEPEGDDELAAAQRRLRREQFRSYRNMAMAGIGMATMIGTLFFFLRLRS